jgi:hypothetical protein
LVRIGSALLFFSLAAACGFGLASWIAPDGLRRVAERELGALLGTPVAFRRVSLGLGLGIELIGEDARLFDDASGARLFVHEVRATLDTRALLARRFSLTQLELVGARARVARDAEGRWTPNISAPAPAPVSPVDEAEPWMRALRELEAAAHGLLAERWIANTLALRESALILELSPPPGAVGAEPDTVSVERLQAQLDAPRGDRAGRIRIAGRVFHGNRPFGRLEVLGRRTADGALDLELAATALELRELDALLPRSGSRARLAGELTGVLGLDTRGSERERVELDLLLSDFEGDLGRITGLAPLRSDRVSARFDLELSPEQIDIAHARIASGDLDLQLAGEIERPLRARSRAALSASFREVALARGLQQAGFFPLPNRPEAGSRVEAGTLRQLTARGRATLVHWRDFFSGKTAKPPEQFSIEAELAGGELLLDSGQRLSAVSGQIRFEGDRAVILGARARLDDKPLPVLDIDLDGVSHLVATPAERRHLRTRGDRLLGLRALWAVLRPEHSEDEPEPPPRLLLSLDHLDHPAVLWPLQSVEAELFPLPHGVRAEISRALWAGAPTTGSVEWEFEPEEHVRARLTLAAPVAELPERDAPEAWALGRFFVGAIDSQAWRQQQATGHLAAHEGRVSLDDVSILLAPRGALTGRAELDLSRPEAVPASLDLALSNADVGALAEQLGGDSDLITGTLRGSGQLRGALHPGQPFFSDLSGTLTLAASDGRIRRKLPAMVAIALANDTLNPFAKRKSLRYSKIETELALDRGRSRTEAFAIDGPDVRMFASGTLDIGHAPHALEADVAVFLFRQFDRVLEQIPLVSTLLLGEDDSVMAAYYRVQGPWNEPKADLVPLRTLTANGPVGILVDGLPHFVQRSFEAIGAMVGQPLAPKDANPGPPGAARERAAPALPDDARAPVAGSS